MKRSRFMDSQIISILKQAEGGSPMPELCREHGISSGADVPPADKIDQVLLGWHSLDHAASASGKGSWKRPSTTPRTVMSSSMASQRNAAPLRQSST